MHNKIIKRMVVYYCCLQKQKVQFVPDKWQQNIGQVCISCKSHIDQSNSVSLCRCFLFCHEQCFLKQFSPYIVEHQLITCIRCDQQIKFDFSFFYKWHCNRSPFRLILIAIAILVNIIMFILVGVGVFREGFSDSVGYGIFSALAVVLIIAILLGMRKKFINLEKTKVQETGLKSVQQSYKASSTHLKGSKGSQGGRKRRKDKKSKAANSKGSSMEFISASESEKDVMHNKL